MKQALALFVFLQFVFGCKVAERSRDSTAKGTGARQYQKLDFMGGGYQWSKVGPQPPFSNFKITLPKSNYVDDHYGYYNPLLTHPVARYNSWGLNYVATGVLGISLNAITPDDMQSRKMLGVEVVKHVEETGVSYCAALAIGEGASFNGRRADLQGIKRGNYGLYFNDKDGFRRAVLYKFNKDTADGLECLDWILKKSGGAVAYGEFVLKENASLD